jgi:predicted subunit of tRNA(5-methylaminomethyl-2-thiouridylate) methyltransferase
MKWHGLGHEALDVAMGHTLIEEAGRISLSHKLEETSYKIEVRRLLRQEVVYS